MTFIRKLLALCAFATALGAGSPVLAADTPAGEKAPQDLILRGDAKCTTCHDENDDPNPSKIDQRHPSVLAMAATKHGVKADGRTPTCTSCHGDSEKHIKSAGSGGKGKPVMPDVTYRSNTENTASERAGRCLTCHEGDKRTHWAGSQHESRDIACTNCHNMHTKNDKVMSKQTQAEVCFACHKTERALTHRMSTHPLDAGKMSCSDCHNPHGSNGPKLMVKTTIVETCLTCHTEKRGPFLWEHTPVTEDCMNCHTPHGSTNQPLLKARAPWLCEQCHQSPGSGHYGYFDANSLPGGPAVTTANSNNASSNPVNPITGQKLKTTAPNPRLAMRGCVNCHSQIHGSNAPGGSRFVR